MDFKPKVRSRILEQINSQLESNIDFQDRLFEHWLQTLPTAKLISPDNDVENSSTGRKIIWSSETVVSPV